MKSSAGSFKYIYIGVLGAFKCLIYWLGSTTTRLYYIQARTKNFVGFKQLNQLFWSHKTFCTCLCVRRFAFSVIRFLMLVCMSIVSNDNIGRLWGLFFYVSVSWKNSIDILIAPLRKLLGRSTLVKLRLII